MMQHYSMRGVVPVVPSPFQPDESVDLESLRAVVDWIAGAGLAGMCLPAYGSEFYKLSEAERDLVVSVAIEQCDGRIPVIAQANHPSALLAAELAGKYEAMGADIISFALPRQFGTSAVDIVDYCATVAAGTTRPVMVQDFNPGGVSIGTDLVEELSDRIENLQFLKLEDPMMTDKLADIRNRVGVRVSIFEGWGGLYMLEGIAAGIQGIMPGVAIADLLDKVYSAADSGDGAEAYSRFGALLPFITFTLQNFELFLQVEKRALVRSGLIQSATVRSLSYSMSPRVLAHADYLIDQIERIRTER